MAKGNGMAKWSALIGWLALMLGESTDVHAQEAATTPDPEPEATTVQEIVVVGSRAEPRLATETAAPVDVISGTELQSRGFTDLARTLEFLAPSVNYPRTATGPSAANTRAVTLRGLGPDQVLVLINGKRRHASSVINFNNVVGRGTVPVDLNTIPMSAIKRIEILRDGAAAQYGSDAIAGVINIVLKDNTHGGDASLRGGVTEDGDGENATVAADHGFASGDNGFVSIGGEARYRDFTNSAAIDSRYARVTNRQGDPESLDLSFAANAQATVGAGVDAYGHLTLARRVSESAAQFRDPSVAPPLYPDGFLPLIKLRMSDAGGSAGLRGRLGGWDWDLSDTAGFNDADFDLSDSANTSLGEDSPRHFDAGGTHYLQNLVNLGFNRRFGQPLQGLNLAVGLEHRYESFRIDAGEPASVAGAGAQGFPGFNPPAPIDASRRAYSAYIDAELQASTWLGLGAALRHEDYQDAGGQTTGKLSLFARTSEWAALRATGGTGFRAPSLQQRYFSTVSSQSSGGVLVNVGTFAVDDPVAQALGAQPLKSETSRQYSGGVVLTPLRDLALTLDVFRIDIDDRIILSESLGGPEVQAVLNDKGISNVSQVRFFTNAADTRSDGWDLGAAWKTRLTTVGEATLSLAYTRTDTELQRIRTNPALPSLPLLGLPSIDLLTEAQPKDKWLFNSRLHWQRWSATLDVTRFGSFRSVPVKTEQRFAPTVTIDVGLSFSLGSGVTLEGGILNATDAYPDKVDERALTQGGSLQYTEVGGLGTEGREYFLRIRAGL